MNDFDAAFTLHRQGKLDDAARLYRAILARTPNHSGALTLLGMIVLSEDGAQEAEQLLSRSAAHDPRNPMTHGVRGVALARLNRFDEALLAFDHALRLKPDYFDAWNDRGVVLRDMGRLDDALASFDRAIAISPRFANAFYNRGKTLHDLGRREEALDSHARAIALEPTHVAALNNRGVVFLELKRFDEALACFHRVLELNPDYAEAHLNRGMARLLTGDFALGWDDFEYRWKQKDYRSKRSGVPAPEWTGEDVSGRSILVYDEEGLGDTIQFCRYLPLLAARGADVSMLLRSRLSGLLKSLPGSVRLLTAIPGGEQFDFQVPLLSLPHRFATTMATVPARVPYISADPERAVRWADKIGDDSFKVGLCWQGSPTASIDIGRSIPLREFAPLAQVRGVRFISLQKHYGLDQLGSLPPGFAVETLGEDFDSGPDAFADTAAVMSHLDLVVTSDTSIAHLAGALGRPVWLALKYAPDWRWLAEGDASPWYPSMRLFRQSARDDWAGVFRRIAAELTIR